jgi:hypothetical protein
MNSLSIIVALIGLLIVLGAVLGPILAHHRHAVESQAKIVAGYDPSMQTTVNEKKTKNPVG